MLLDAAQRDLVARAAADWTPGGGGGGGGGGGDGGGENVGRKEPSELPPPLAAILRDHTLLHINALQHAAGGTGGAPSAENRLSARTPAASAVSSSVSPQVAALIGYDRRRRNDTPLNGRVAALVGYGRRHHAPVPLERRGSDA